MPKNLHNRQLNYTSRTETIERGVIELFRGYPQLATNFHVLLTQRPTNWGGSPGSDPYVDPQRSSYGAGGVDSQIVASPEKHSIPAADPAEIVRRCATRGAIPKVLRCPVRHEYDPRAALLSALATRALPCASYMLTERPELRASAELAAASEAQFDMMCALETRHHDVGETERDSRMAYWFGDAPRVHLPSFSSAALQDEIRAAAYAMRGDLRVNFAREVDRLVQRNRQFSDTYLASARWKPADDVAKKRSRPLFRRLACGADSESEAEDADCKSDDAGIGVPSGSMGVEGPGEADSGVVGSDNATGRSDGGVQTPIDASDGASSRESTSYSEHANAADSEATGSTIGGIGTDRTAVTGAPVRKQSQARPRACDIRIACVRPSKGKPKKATSARAYDKVRCTMSQIGAAVSRTPRLTTYISIKSNDRVDDEPVLHFVPYFGDDQGAYNGLDLAEGYDHILKEQSVRAFSPVEDVLLRSVVAYYGNQEYVHRLLADVIPGVTWRDLNKRFEMFRTQDRRIESFRTNRRAYESMAPRSRVTCAFWMPPIVVFSNTDRYKSELALRAPAETSSRRQQYRDLTESYRDLLCRRCFVYDCKLHGVRHPLPQDRAASLEALADSVRQNEKRRRTIFKKSAAASSGDGGAGAGAGADAYPTWDSGTAVGQASSAAERVSCSPDCFKLHTDGALQLQLTREWLPGGEIPGDVPALGDGEASEWSSAECVLLIKLVEVTSGNPCAIAQLMKSRSCLQVWRAGRKRILKFLLKQRQHELAAEKSESESDAKSSGPQTAKRFRPDPQVELHHEYRPCSHKGPCTPDVCDCAKKGVRCEKYCPCPPSCHIKFRGCRCRMTQKGRCTVSTCVCVAGHRECDPDLCQCCVDTHVYPPTSKGLPKHLVPDVPRAEAAEGERLGADPHVCRNMALTVGAHTTLRVAPSNIHGWGGFVGEGSYVRNQDMVYEYCGEIISQDEADRRGKIYDKHRVSFLFNLNSELVVDATRKGNKLRFVNHSTNPNCVPKVLRVRCDHRIGIFAKVSR